MKPTSVRGLVGDTSFWIEAFDPTCDHHKDAAGLLEDLRDKVILMPWPLLYEVLRTRTVRNTLMLRAFDRLMRQPKFLRIEDSPYRVGCLEATVAQAVRGSRSISLVDMVVRAVLDDRQYRITQLLTFNPRDFVDVCRRRNVAIWPTP